MHQTVRQVKVKVKVEVVMEVRLVPRSMPTYTVSLIDRPLRCTLQKAEYGSGKILLNLGIMPPIGI